MTVVPGTYRHYKPGGRQYLVLGLAHDANDPARTAVVYVPLYPVDGPPLAVRTLADFTALVDPASPPPPRRRSPGAVRRFVPVRGAAGS